MKFEGLVAQNFMSFKELEFVFPSSGLFFVSGEVEGKVSSSNGAGKSTLFEALAFCLFGKTIRGLSKSEIVNRQAGKDCAVILLLEADNGKEYTISRYRDHSKYANELRLESDGVDLTSGTSTETQKTIEFLIGMNWLVFSNAVIFGQSATRFAAATDAEKKLVFDEILMLDIYQQAQTKVKDAVKELQATVPALQQRIAFSESTIDSTKSSIESEKRILEGLEKQATSSERVAEIKVFDSKLDKEKKALVQSILDMKKELLVLDERAAVSYNRKEKAEAEKNKEISPIRTQIIILDSEVTVKRRQLNEFKSSVAKVDSLVGKPCPVCSQPVEASSQQAVVDHYNAEILGLTYAIDVANESKQALSEDLLSVEAKYSSLISEAAVERDLLSKEQRDKNAKLMSLSLRDKSIDGERSALAVEKRKISEDLTSRKKEIQQRIIILEGKIVTSMLEKSEYIAQLDVLVDQEKYLKFWIEGFGNSGIKSLLLDEVLPELNDSVAYFSSLLTDGELIVSFDTETQLKTGDKRDKFGIRICKNGVNVSYESCSGGEKRRVDVPILLALQMLIFKRSVKSINFCALDEIFESLDAAGVEKVVNILHESSKGKAVLVISHQSEFREFFENQIVIRNVKGISTLEQ